MRESVLRKKIYVALLIGMSSSVPVHAGFYFEGMATYIQEPRCNDPYALDQEGCVARTPGHADNLEPGSAYGLPPETAGSDSGIRYETREEIELK